LLDDSSLPDDGDDEVEIVSIAENLNLILGAAGVEGVVGVVVVGVFNGATTVADAASDVGIESGNSESEIGRGFDSAGGGAGVVDFATVAGGADAVVVAVVDGADVEDGTVVEVELLV
jgi:hypothetical protein